MSELSAAYVPLPSGLAEMMPGPDLAAVLASLDRRACNGYQLVDLLVARTRQIGWEQAQLLADVNELAHSARGRYDDPPRRVASGDSHVVEELSFGLRWTTATAEQHLALAWALIDCQPVLYNALVEGHIDVAKARMIVDEVDLLNDGQTRAVIGRILPDANLVTLPQLRARIRKLVLTIDADLVRRRYKRDVSRRNVSVTEYRNGTSSITGRYLPTDKVAAAMDYLNRTATATVRAGDPAGTRFDDRDKRTAAQIRADVFLDLLAGVDPTIPADQGGAGAVNPAPRKGTVNVSVDLETLMCLQDHAGELAGFGPVVADIARQVADGLIDAPVWRFTVTDQGRVIHEGRLHYRPTAAQKAYVTARDQRCQAPGCRRPAIQCDIDHIVAWDDHGITHEDNLCVLCKRHHVAKHNGFQLHRTDFGLLWITPRGRAHPVSFGHELDADQRRILQEVVNHWETTQTFTPRRQ
jgi:hypothetical protein